MPRPKKTESSEPLKGSSERPRVKLRSKETPPPPPPPGPPKTIYGLEVGNHSPLDMERMAFLLNPPTGLGRYGHFRNVARMLFPNVSWNPWLEDQIQCLCDYEWVSWPGCAGSGKTFAVSFYGVVWWLMNPTMSSVILTSTTKDMIRKRAWGVVQSFYHAIPGLPVGNMVDSRTTWQAVKGDDKHAISAIAVRQGSTQEAVARIQGYHTRRQLVVVDEATDTPEAIFEACANLYNSPEDFQFVALANPASRLDPFGRFSEPNAGWSSISVADRSWRTKPQLNGVPGVVLRFDAEESPNIREGKTLYPYLVTEDQLEGARRRYGKDNPLFWKFQRGFWAPDGTLKTVLSESLITRQNLMGTHEFSGEFFTDVAGLDPAFGGGDRAVFYPARVGILAGGTLSGIQFRPPVLMELQASSSEPIHFQLARQAKALCRAHNVSPDCLAVDSTGEGGGLCDILQRDFGPILRVEFGGSASDAPLNYEDRRPAREVYQNKVCEIWFAVREFALSGQLRGLDASTCVEFCNRTYNDEKRRMRLQTKVEMKEEYGRSPDLGDAAALALEAGRRAAGLSLSGVYGEAMVDPRDAWRKKAVSAASVWSEDHLAVENF